MRCNHKSIFTENQLTKQKLDRCNRESIFTKNKKQLTKHKFEKTYQHEIDQDKEHRKKSNQSSNLDRTIWKSNNMAFENRKHGNQTT